MKSSKASPRAFRSSFSFSLNNDVGQKGSANQRCIILNSELIDKYNDFDTKKRSRQNFVANGKIISVGIPTKCIYK